MKLKISRLASNPAVALIFFLLFGVCVVWVESQCKVDISSGAQVLLTGVLVWVTWSYTRATMEMAKTAREQLVVSSRDAESREAQVKLEPVRRMWEISFELAEIIAKINARLEAATAGDGIGLIAFTMNIEDTEEQTRNLTLKKHEALAVMPLCPPEAGTLIDTLAKSSTLLESVALRTTLAAKGLPSHEDADALPPTLEDLESNWKALGDLVSTEVEWSKVVDKTYSLRVEHDLVKLRLVLNRALLAG